MLCASRTDSAFWIPVNAALALSILSLISPMESAASSREDPVLEEITPNSASILARFATLDAEVSLITPASKAACTRVLI